MKTLTDVEAAAWCLERNIDTSGRLPADRLSFRDTAGWALRIPQPNVPLDIVSLAYTVLLHGTPDDDEAGFEGGLVWLQDWDIWPEATERVGHLLLVQLRALVGDRQVHDAPALLFERGDFVAAQAALVLPLVFQWDAYYVPASAHFLAFCSHHEHMRLLTRNEQSHLASFGRFERAAFRPTVAER